jgi:Tol biopolymer transport system component
VFLRRAQEWAGSVDGDPIDPAWSVWVRDRAAQTTLLASVNSAGQPLPGPSLSPAISGDGHHVAFSASWPSASTTQIVVRDLDQGSTRLASVDPFGQLAQAACDRPSLSRDGRFVAFTSNDIQLAGTPATAPSVYVKDLVTGALELASVSSAGVAANADSFLPGISADGQRVVFHSQADNLVAGDDNGVIDVFVHDLAAGWTRRASVASDGTLGSHDSLFGAMSPDGRYVAFGSDAPEFAPGDAGPWADVFVHDLETQQTNLVSKAVDGGFANNHSGEPQVSEGGLIVAFESLATDLVPVDANGEVADVFVADLSPFTSLGGAAPGGPELLATGSLLPASIVDLVIGTAEPGAAGLLLVAGAPGSLPFAGGTLFAVPALASLAVAFDAHGEAHAAGHWPAGVAAGLAITLQAVVASPGGLIPGNAVTAITP